jgi:hypothetical protein
VEGEGGEGRDSRGVVDHVVLCGDVAGPSTDRDSDRWAPGARVRIWVLLIGDGGLWDFCLPRDEEKSVDVAGWLTCGVGCNRSCGGEKLVLAGLVYVSNKLDGSKVSCGPRSALIEDRNFLYIF